MLVSDGGADTCPQVSRRIMLLYLQSSRRDVLKLRFGVKSSLRCRSRLRQVVQGMSYFRQVPPRSLTRLMPSSKATARWDISISVTTDSAGIKVNVIGSTVPQFETTMPTNYESASKMSLNPEALLREKLSERIEIAQIVEELKAFEGIWEFCYPGVDAYMLTNPTFNARGDLLFELKSYSAYGNTSTYKETSGVETSPKLDVSSGNFSSADVRNSEVYGDTSSTRKCPLLERLCPQPPSQYILTFS